MTTETKPTSADYKKRMVDVNVKMSAAAYGMLLAVTSRTTGHSTHSGIFGDFMKAYDAADREDKDAIAHYYARYSEFFRERIADGKRLNSDVMHKMHELRPPLYPKDVEKPTTIEKTFGPITTPSYDGGVKVTFNVIGRSVKIEAGCREWSNPTSMWSHIINKYMDTEYFTPLSTVATEICEWLHVERNKR